MDYDAWVCDLDERGINGLESSGIFFLPPERSLKVADSVDVFWPAVSAFKASSPASSTST
jgi:hypothetical protein